MRKNDDLSKDVTLSMNFFNIQKTLSQISNPAKINKTNNMMTFSKKKGCFKLILMNACSA